MKKKPIFLIKLLISCSLLLIILLIIPLSEIIRAIMSADSFLIIIAVLLVVPVVILSSFQTGYLLKAQKMSISLIDIIRIYLTTSFYSAFLPGSLSGGIVKWYKMAKYGTKLSAAAVVLFNRFLEIFTVLALGLLYSVLSLYASSFYELTIFMCVMLSGLIVLYIVLFSGSFPDRISQQLKRRIKSKFLSGKIKDLLDAQKNFRDLKFADHLSMLSVMALYHLLNLISFYLMALSIGISINIFTLGWIGSVVTILSLFPFTISGFGVREGSLIFLLGYYGIPPESAVALSFLTVLRIIFLGTAGGIIELKDFFSDRNRGLNKA